MRRRRECRRRSNVSAAFLAASLLACSPAVPETKAPPAKIVAQEKPKLSRKPVVAPKPEEVVRKVTEDKYWFTLAANIQSPSDFKVFEPVLYEITGENPVSSSDVFFLPDNEIKQSCRRECAGCYTIYTGKIYVNTGKSSPGLDDGYSGIGYCKMQSEKDLSHDSRIGIWLHEQGHRYDRYYGKSDYETVVNELEAEAFKFYVAEHIAKNYDKRLGMSLMQSLFRQQAFLDLNPLFKLEKKEISINDLNDKKQRKLADISVLVLMGSGLETLGDIWYYVHSHSHEEVFKRIIENAPKVEDGFKLTNELAIKLLEADLVVPDTFDVSPFENFKLSDDHPSLNWAGGKPPDPNQLGISWPAGKHTVKFQHYGEAFWDLEYSIGGIARKKFGIMIADDNGRANMRFIGPNYIDPVQILDIPDINSDKAKLIINSNPAELKYCVTKSKEITVDSSYYVKLVKQILEELRSNIEKAGDKVYLRYVEDQIEEISKLLS